jgi:seryl-tRNA synthetase
MLDPKILRENPLAVAEQLATRGFVLDVETLQNLEAKRKVLQIETEKLQNERNLQSKKIGQLKAAGQSVDAVMAHIAGLGDKLKAAEEALGHIQKDLLKIVEIIPNIPHSSTPIGKDEAENVEIRQWGIPKQFDFEIKDHVLLGGDLLDADAASRITGSRFVVLHGKMARLQRALAQFMLDLHTEVHGYQEIYVPYLVTSDSLYGTGQLPKLADDMFAIKDTDFWLIPTSEVAVTNIMREQIIDSEKLPLKYVCHSPCFRKEAGTYGKDMRGMLRQHQFDKVEMVQMVLPEDSYAALESMVTHAEAVLQKLNLPYRVVSLCTGDISFGPLKLMI